MNTFDAIIIGGGHNGLVAAATLARRGKSVLVLEQGETLGGMAAPGALGSARAPHLAHLVHNLSPKMRKSLGLGDHGWPFELQELDTVALCPGGRHAVISGRIVRHANGDAHPDAREWLALTRRMIRYGELLRALAEAPPPGGGAPVTSRAGLAQLLRLGRFGLGVKGLGKDEMREFLRVLLSNAADLILDEMPDGPLAGLLAADALRGATAGPRAPGTVFSLIYRMAHGGRPYLAMGGMGRLVDALAKSARDANCRIDTGAKVARVLIEKDQVTGVETVDGQQFLAPLVMSNAGPQTTARMTGLDHFDIEAARRLRVMRSKGSAAKINLRLSALPRLGDVLDDLRGARFVYAPGVNHVEEAFNPAKYRKMSADPVIEAVIPTATDPGLDPALTSKGHHILSMIVQYAPYDLDGGWTPAARDTLLKTSVSTLARFAPDLPGLIEDTEVICPPDIEDLTGAPGGHWHHGEMSLDQLLSIRPANGMGHYRMGPRGLYLCGASAHPGGDLMGLAGMNAAQQALNDEALS